MFNVSPPVSLGRAQGFGGIFSEVLNVVGATFVGDPALGDQLASKAGAAYAPITQTPQEIADTISTQVLADLKSPVVIKPDNLSASIAAAVAPFVAANLARQGYAFAPGSLGASYVHPSAFGSWLSSAVKSVGGWVAGDGNTPGNPDTRSLGYDTKNVAAATANLLSSAAPISINTNWIIGSVVGLGLILLLRNK